MAHDEAEGQRDNQVLQKLRGRFPGVEEDVRRLHQDPRTDDICKRDAGGLTPAQFAKKVHDFIAGQAH